ncbi:MAG: hypothetical protein M1354_04485 [Candidatus Marsarchaeota archaeon]|jgi:hypothetical protein|nr:hypothetical protein [Candidatus Marsarchaeota archaeon]
MALAKQAPAKRGIKKLIAVVAVVVVIVVAALLLLLPSNGYGFPSAQTISSIVGTQVTATPVVTLTGQQIAAIGGPTTSAFISSAEMESYVTPGNTASLNITEATFSSAGMTYLKSIINSSGLHLTPYAGGYYVLESGVTSGYKGDIIVEITTQGQAPALNVSEATSVVEATLSAI